MANYDEFYFIQHKLCPLCLEKAHDVKFKSPNNPNILMIACEKCNPNSLNEFCFSRDVFFTIFQLTDTERSILSENIKQNNLRKEGVEPILIRSENINTYLKKSRKWQP